MPPKESNRRKNASREHRIEHHQQPHHHHNDLDDWLEDEEMDESESISMDDVVDDEDDEENDEELDPDMLGGELGLNLQSLRGLFGGGASHRFRELHKALRRSAHDAPTRLLVLQELSEALSVATEDVFLGAFPLDALVVELLWTLGGPEPKDHLVSDRHAPDDDNDDDLAAVLASTAHDAGESEEAQIYACRCIAHMLEALPESAHCIVRRGAVRLLVGKLQEIAFIDLAEQVLQTLEKLSATHAPAIIREGGMLAVLQYLDFFGIYVQRVAMSTVANCCRHLTQATAKRALEVVPIVGQVLGYSDTRLVESACRCVCLMTQKMAEDEQALEQLMSHLLPAVCALLERGLGNETNSLPTLPNDLYTDVLDALGQAARISTSLVHSLVEHHLVSTLFVLLTGAPDPTVVVPQSALLQNFAMHSPVQIQAAVSLLRDVLPPLPQDGIFDARAYSEKAYMQKWRRAERAGCKIGELDPSLDDAPVRRQSASALKRQRAAETRAEAQRAWPHFFERYMAQLVPVFLCLYTASGSLQLRETILTAILRVLYYADAATLDGQLDKRAFASFLAGVLASQEHVICVDAALQAVELLVSRMPFLPLLLREGVVWHVEQLANDDVRERDRRADNHEEVPSSSTSSNSGSAPAPRFRFRAKLVHERLKALPEDASVAAARRMVHDLEQLAERVLSRSNLSGALHELASIIPRITSFELHVSGLVEALYECVTEDADGIDSVNGQSNVQERRALLRSALMPAKESLVACLHASLSRLEDLNVKALGGPSSLTKHLKLRLVPEETTAERLPRPYRSLTVSIHAIMTTQALHDFLKPKIQLALSPNSMSGLSGMLAALAAAAGRPDDVPRNEDNADDDMDVADDPADAAGDDVDVSDDVDVVTDNVAEHHNDNTAETSQEKNLDDASVDMSESGHGADIEHTDAHAASQIKNEKSTHQRAGPSYASAAQSSKSAWHLAFELNGTHLPLDATLYRCLEEQRLSTGAADIHTVKYKIVPGPPAAPSQRSEHVPMILPAHGFQQTLPNCIPNDAPYARTMQLLGALRDLWENDLSDDLFVNTKLSAKLAQQLEEPLVLASGCLPAWAVELPLMQSFLFTFDTRLRYVQMTAMGYARLLSQCDKTHMDDLLTAMSRLPRQKVRISRANLLASAVKVLELYAKGSSILEIEYFDEVGSGLGPTLEFYALVSREFQLASLQMWRNSNGASKGYVPAGQGLFPAPIDDTDPLKNKVVPLFYTLGQFVAKSLLDSRIIDVPFHPLFWRAVLARRVPCTLEILGIIDPTLSRSLRALLSMPSADLDALGMDFSMPGNERILPSASDTNDTRVTASNVNTYVQAVLDMSLRDGISQQITAFRQGFDSVMPLRSLNVFHSKELVALFGQSNEDWDESTLFRTIVPDHGFSGDSTPFRDLVCILSQLTKEERRTFVQWLTGSPRLPLGGFAALQPPFTVVRRQHEAPLKPDDYLPSVMTCVNYLKLPCYSNREVMKSRLFTAMHEGLTSFYLS